MSDHDLAIIDVSVYYRGQSHREVLRVSDSVTRAFIHSLLTEAVDRVRSSMNEDRDADYPFQQRVSDSPNETGNLAPDPRFLQGLLRGGDIVSLSRGADGLLKAEVVAPAPPPDAPPLPTGPDLLDSLNAIQTCRSVVWRSLADRKGRTRQACGRQLNDDGSCPNAARHIGASLADRVGRGEHVQFEDEQEPSLSKKEAIAQQYLDRFGQNPPEYTSIDQMIQALNRGKVIARDHDPFD